MNINPINHTNSTSFNGKLILKGNWPKHLADELKEHYAIKQIAKSEYDVVATMLSKKATKNTDSYSKGEQIYKVILSAIKEKPTKQEKLNYKSDNYPKIELSEHFHSDESTASILLKKIKPEVLSKNLNIFV